MSKIGGYTSFDVGFQKNILEKMQGLETARKEMGLSDKDDKPIQQRMFKAI